MKCTTVIDKIREEEVVIYVREKTELSQQIEDFVLGRSLELIGYKEGEIIKLSPIDIVCFTVENGKVYAVLDREKVRMKQRLYTIEEMIGKSFVKINQSCIANVGKIKKFDASLAGALRVEFKNGYKDYISRRQMKTVKERIGIK